MHIDLIVMSTGAVWQRAGDHVRKLTEPDTPWLDAAERLERVICMHAVQSGGACTINIVLPVTDAGEHIAACMLLVERMYRGVTIHLRYEEQNG